MIVFEKNIPLDLMVYETKTDTVYCPNTVISYVSINSYFSAIGVTLSSTYTIPC